MAYELYFTQCVCTRAIEHSILSLNILYIYSCVGLLVVLLPTLTILTSGRCSLPADHSFLLTIDSLHHSIVRIAHLAVGKCGSPNFIKYLGPVDPNWTREKPDTKHAKKTVRKKPTNEATCLLCNSCTYIINQMFRTIKVSI